MNVGQMLYQPVGGENESSMRPGMEKLADAMDTTAATTAGDLLF